MLLSDTLHIALRAMAAKKSRSLLTTLGIIIGVGSVVLMTAVGESMEGVILGQISSLGARSMVIFPGSEEGPASRISAGFDILEFDDVEALERLTTVTSIAPVIFLTGTPTYGREETAAQVFGAHPNFFRNQSIVPAAGRLLDAEDDERASAVAVLGWDAARDLFGNLSPLGKRVQVADRSYTVVGVAKPLGSQFFQNADDRIYVPFALARAVSGQSYVNYITLQAVADPALAVADVRTLLRARHRIENSKGDEAEDGFIVRTAEQANAILGGVSLGLTLFITTIAGISLVVGGIGIMNVMLVAVTERTREIGLRKALGARRRDILLQFLAEAVALTLLGGIVGVVLGIAVASLTAAIVTRFLATYLFAVSLPAVAVALGMAACTGVLFGLSPARRAASLLPIDALRYE